MGWPQMLPLPPSPPPAPGPLLLRQSFIAAQHDHARLRRHMLPAGSIQLGRTHWLVAKAAAAKAAAGGAAAAQEAQIAHQHHGSQKYATKGCTRADEPADESNAGPAEE